MRVGLNATGFLLALISAILLWAGLPGGGGFWPILTVALVPLLFICHVENNRHRFTLGLVAGLFHFMFQLYWIVIVLGRYGGIPWFFSYPAMVLLSLYMALYFAFFLFIAGYVQKNWRMGVAVWGLPIIWVGLDWLRSVLFSGFPWMDLGYGAWQEAYFIQVADLLGHHFITFLILLVNCLVFNLIQRGPVKRKALQFCTVTTLVIAVLIYGQLRIQQLESEITEAETAHVGIVQGNIDQSRKWSSNEQKRTVDIYIEQTEKLIEQPMVPDLIIWPETALPFFPSRSLLFGYLQKFIAENRINLLAGSPWFEIRDVEKREVDYYNSAFLISSQGNIGDMYFKSHLVPFGEYVPIKKFLPFLAPLVEAVGDFSPGEIVRPLTAGNIRSGVLICFESIFPDIAREWANKGANILVNLTNDAWYGRSSAPSQSMAMSVFRAVETRRSLVRSANTGISAFVDPLGRIQSSSDIFISWAESEEVILMEGQSFHSRYGYLFGPLCFLITLLCISTLLFIRRKKHFGNNCPT